MEKGEAVCIIGMEVKKCFFSEEDLIGKFIKCGKIWLRVIGVLKKCNVFEESLACLGIWDYNLDVYILVSIVLLWFCNWVFIILDDLGNNDENKVKNYYQFDCFVVWVDDSKKFCVSVDVIVWILQCCYLQVLDVEIEVLELFFEQEQ